MDSKSKGEEPRPAGWHTRREFLEALVPATCATCLATMLPGHVLARAATKSGSTPETIFEILRNAPEARYWIAPGDAPSSCRGCHDPGDGINLQTAHDHKEHPVQCQLCARQCLIFEGERGMCRSRMNVGGKLRSLVYGRPAAVHVDPIEKKPFYHFLPGAMAFSLATTGCPLRCKFCQNWELSQSSPEDYSVSFTPPDLVVSAARDRKTPVIAFTYNEPTVFIEYLTDIARKARKRGMASVLVSCGFMAEEPLAEMCEVLDGIKIDLKGYGEDFYREVCGAHLGPVLRSIKQISQSGVHLEIVNLVVPTLNDSEPMLRELSNWIVGELGPDVPIHFTRFHPDYRLLNLPPTPSLDTGKGLRDRPRSRHSLSLRGQRPRAPRR